MTLGLGALPALDHSHHASRRAGNRGVAGPAGPLPRGQAGRARDVQRSARHAAEPGRRGAEGAHDGLPRRPRKDPIRWRATLYGWIACFAQASEFSTFAFYLPVLFAMVGVSSILGNNLVTMALFVVRGGVGLGRAAADAEDRSSRHRHRRAFASCWRRSWSLRPRSTRTTRYVLPFAAAAMLWGHYWDASNCMTIPTMVAKPEYRGTASGFAYMFVKLPSFLAIFLFPALFAAIGQAERHAVRRDLPADRVARGDLHPAGGLRLRAGLTDVPEEPAAATDSSSGSIAPG